ALRETRRRGRGRVSPAPPDFVTDATCATIRCLTPVRCAPGLLVERGVDLRDLLGLAGLVARGRVGARLAAEGEVAEPVLADLLERLQERLVLLGQEVARDRLGRADLDRPVALEA